MDIVYPIGPGDRPFLRYSLRSLSNLPHDNVYIVGELPDWVNPETITFIPTKRIYPKWRSSTHNLMTAASDDRISDEFVMMNDDFFIMQAIMAIPVYHRGNLHEVIKEVTRRVGNSTWVRGMHESVRILTGQGIDNPLCYALHVPMVFNKAALRQTILTNRAMRSRLVEATDLRTMYGNLNQLGGELMRDVKLNEWNSETDTVFLSSGPLSWSSPKTQLIRDAFPDKCQYERL
jgi:hypothetical protein